jgi:hypothetical protein
MKICQVTPQTQKVAYHPAAAQTFEPGGCAASSISRGKFVPQEVVPCVDVCHLFTVVFGDWQVPTCMKLGSLLYSITTYLPTPAQLSRHPSSTTGPGANLSRHSDAAPPHFPAGLACFSKRWFGFLW